jgi:PAS domain S-box-containing protein
MEWVHCHIARQPTPPNERLENVPAPLSAIIMKLLAKAAEERYQTAAGLESDLRRCLAEWEDRGRIDEFPLGERDTPGRLLIPEKLYGRVSEIATLLASFDRVVAHGTPELVLVAGYSGIGKSSVVNELHKVLVPTRGLFASGKFDQYKRDIPYATLAQAFQSLVRPLLSKPEAELRRWRDAFREALGPNGLLMVDLVPELKHVIGEQPQVPVLAPQDAQRRFQLVLRRFIGVFARPEHPLALFIDDLQWLDAATLDLLEDLLSQPDVRHLMLIGAYRDNEVDSAHPLMRKLNAIPNAARAVQEVVLAPLAREDLAQLIADSLRCEPARTTPLARLLHEKTAGNPFFAIQFLSSLAEEGLLTFEHREARWSWDLEQIRAKGYTDNVVDFTVAKIHRLPPATQNALQQLACLGNSADVETLRRVYPNEDMDGQLWEAVNAGLVCRSEDSWRFLHDRVQEAAYSLIPHELRAATHLRIGRLLAACTPRETRDEAIFEIVNQLNRGSHLLTVAEEREAVAELNLRAGRRAKASTAYASALTYLAAGRALLTEDDWSENFELIFSIELLTAECELMTGDTTASEDRLSSLSRRAASAHHSALVTRLRLTLYTTRNRSDRAVEVCLEYLRRVGTDWSLRPTDDEVRGEYDRIWSQLGDREIEELIDLPLMTNPDVLDTLEVLGEMVSPAKICDQNLFALVLCRMINLSLEHGNSDGSCFAYTWFTAIAGPRFGNYRDGYPFGRLGYELVEKRGLTRHQARTYVSFGNIVSPWARHARSGRHLIRSGFDLASRMGDLTFAAYACNELISNLLTVGDPLAEVQTEAEHALAFAKARFALVRDILVGQLGFIRTMRGLTASFGFFDDASFDEQQFEQHLAGSAISALPEFWYCVRKTQARFLAGEYESAIAASLRARELLWTAPSHFETAEFHFYGALAQAAALDSASLEQRHQGFEALLAHHRQLEIWAEHCPENFSNRAALVSAEIARIEGRDLDAQHLYEQAIRSTHANGFIHNEAVAYEVAARFYAARGFDRFAEAYLREARSCYVRWNADGKVRQLDLQHPRLREKVYAASPTSTIGAPQEYLDLATVIKLSQAVSGEIVLERLIDTLMHTAIQHAGAERGLLILARGDDYQIVAEATIRSDTVTVGQLQSGLTLADVPQSVIRYVVRTKETVLLDDAAGDDAFCGDDYIVRHGARSILCLPLLKGSRLVGMLYLQNSLATHAFTPSRMVLLKLLASQAAISLENIRLYADLQEREAKVRRLVDSNIIGILIWGSEGQIIDANEAFLHMLGCARNDLDSGRLRWSELTPTEWRAADEQRLAELKATGTVQPYEKEYFRKNGSRVPVLVGAASFQAGPEEGVAFVVDLTERKQAEHEARKSARRYREVEMELAHANRVATLGQMSASIAHEINQPVAATVTNAQAALRFLASEPRNVEEVRQALNRIVRLGNRVVEVVGRIRALVKKMPPCQDQFAVNDAIDEVISLTQGEMAKNGVLLYREFAAGLPLIRADRVQLQQVILNLITNAVEAMSGVPEAERELRISANLVEADGILITVRDSGSGLDPANSDRVFDPFYTTKPGGLGIGLSICRSIIEAHDGRLWVESSKPRGTVFALTLPANR